MICGSLQWMNIPPLKSERLLLCMCRCIPLSSWGETRRRPVIDAPEAIGLPSRFRSPGFLDLEVVESVDLILTRLSLGI